MAIINTPLDALGRKLRIINEATLWMQNFDSATKTEILDWIRQDQLFKHGIDGTGQIIGYYSPTTESISKGRKKANTHYTFLDLGDFFRSAIILVFKTQIVIQFDGNKGKDNLYDKYGKNLTKLTDEHFQALKEKVKIKTIAYIRSILFGNR